MAPGKLDGVSALIRSHLDAEVQAGFPKLARTPSTGVIRFLDYFDSLTAAERDSLLAALAKIQTLSFFPPQAVRGKLEQMMATTPAFASYRQAMQSVLFSMGLRYLDLRMRKAMLADPTSRRMMAQTRATLNFTPRDDLPPTLVTDPDAAHLKPAKATLLRKPIDEALRKLFATRKEKRPGGETEYSGVLQETRVKVTIDFAAMGLQLRYGVTIPDETKRVFVWQRGYEDLWSAGRGWDYLTEENAEASVHLLCDYVGQIVSLRNAILVAL